jgi:hypothetical protein
MDWNRVEGNWKQLKGKVKEKWGTSLMTTLPRLMAKEISLRAKFKSARQRAA